MSTNRDIKIYLSFEEMEADRLRQAASLNPEEGLRQTVELILRVYGITREDLSKRFLKNKITFTTGRLKDQADIEELQKIHLYKK